MCECTKGWASRCARATSKTCTCNCGGKNHGKLLPGAGDSETREITPLNFRSNLIPPMNFIRPLFKLPNIILRRDLTGHISTNVIRKYVVHSPTGFEWGYGGSGPADLAFNILAMFIPDYWAWVYHQDFKWEFIAQMPKEGDVISMWKIIFWCVGKFMKEEQFV